MDFLPEEALPRQAERTRRVNLIHAELRVLGQSRLPLAANTDWLGVPLVRLA